MYVWIASQACRFLVDARRSGLMELLLVSPLAERDIVSGQWRALRRMFGIPVLLLIIVGVIGAGLSQLGWNRIAAQMPAATTTSSTNSVSGNGGQVGATSTVVTVSPSGTTVLSGGSSFRPSLRQLVLAVVGAAAAAFAALANLLAIGWFGMWMGLTSKSANLATLKTLLFVQVIPWFVISFGTTVLVWSALAGLAYRFQSGPSGWLEWLPLCNALFNAGLVVAKDIGFIVWARKRLFASLRLQVAQGFARFPTTALPPVIAAV
jgi:hypothetical protein